jgi:hypothetical protein
MRISFFTALLKNDSRMAWPFLFLSAFYAYLSIKGYKHDQMFELTSGSAHSTFLFLIPFMLWNFLFSNGNYGFKAANAFTFNSLEFMFSRAISRVTLFCAKTSIFLFLCLLPLVLILVFSLTDPVIRVELPYNSHHHREETKQFYLTHFKEAYLQESDTGNNKDYVVLPHGRIDAARYSLLVIFSGALFFQTTLFFFLKARWMSFTIYFVLALLPSLADGFHGPSPYEVSLAWVTQHTMTAVSMLVLLTILSQLYCCRRFVNTEITS